jgi:DNA-binding NtrC family response regulator
MGGGLRDDLLGRLGAAPIRLPPLRDRIEDLGVLAQFFLDRLAKKDRVTTRGFDGPALRALALAQFPLNVRELEKIVVAAVALAGEGRLVGVADLPETVTAPQRIADVPAAEGAGPSSAPPSRTGRKPPEPAPGADTLAALLREHDGNVAEVARALGRQRAAVWRWIKRYGLVPEQFRGGP